MAQLKMYPVGRTRGNSENKLYPSGKLVFKISDWLKYISDNTVEKQHVEERVGGDWQAAWQLQQVEWPLKEDWLVVRYFTTCCCGPLNTWLTAERLHWLHTKHSQSKNMEGDTANCVSFQHTHTWIESLSAKLRQSSNTILTAVKLGSFWHVCVCVWFFSPSDITNLGPNSAAAWAGLQ